MGKGRGGKSFVSSWETSRKKDWEHTLQDPSYVEKKGKKKKCAARRRRKRVNSTLPRASYLFAKRRKGHGSFYTRRKRKA